MPLGMSAMRNSHKAQQIQPEEDRSE